MPLKEITDRQIWNEFIMRNAADGGFLQSWEWGEFQESYGRKVWRLGFFDEMDNTPPTPPLGKGGKNNDVVLDKNGQLAVGWQLIEMPLKIGKSYLYAPRPGGAITSEFISGIIDFCKKQRTVFLRVDEANDLRLDNYEFSSVNVSIQPREELILDISKPEERLLGQMKPKTRYNIKVAEKHGVKVKNDNSKINDFLNLIQKTSERQDIRSHPPIYYERMIRVLSDLKIAELFFAEYKGKAVATIMVIFFNNMAIYLHGGSDNEYKKIMAPYLLHWEVILEARKRGLKYYNFGGVSNEKESWAGITRFKTGFAPEINFRKYFGVKDLPINKFWYGIYKTAKRI